MSTSSAPYGPGWYENFIPYDCSDIIVKRMYLIGLIMGIIGIFFKNQVPLVIFGVEMIQCIILSLRAALLLNEEDVERYYEGWWFNNGRRISAFVYTLAIVATMAL